MLLGAWSSRPAASSRVIADEEQSMRARHELWMARHKKIYTDAGEKDQRFKIFNENVKRIEAFNARGDKGYRLGVNKFADLTNEEFRMAHTGGYKRVQTKATSTSSRGKHFRYENVTAVGTVLDWRKKGAVTPVKDQRDCGTMLISFVLCCLFRVRTYFYSYKTIYKLIHVSKVEKILLFFDFLYFDSSTCRVIITQVDNEPVVRPLTRVHLIR